MPSGPFFMQKALVLADRARGRSSPNPAVGAVLTRDDMIVGEGYTQPAGGPHAEVVALAQAGERARGATLYVTLEPCCHHGRTPPCTQAIIAAGVAEVHIATLDPNPLVNGQGQRELQEAGIRTLLGDGEEEARILNEAFFKYIVCGRPFVTAKWAMTIDGKMAAQSGDARWVTGEVARARVHDLRDVVDAIVVGVGTVIADDPQLTARPANCIGRAPRDGARPLRVVLDSQGRIPLDARLLSPGLAPGTLVAVTAGAGAGDRARIAATGAEVALLPEREGRVDLEALIELLGERGLVSVLLEAGPTLLGAFFASNLVDKVWAFVAPKVVGGNRAPAAWPGMGTMSEALGLERVRVEQLGKDLLVEGYLPGARHCSRV